jgi:hypothetical protein
MWLMKFLSTCSRIPAEECQTLCVSGFFPLVQCSPLKVFKFFLLVGLREFFRKIWCRRKKKEKTPIHFLRNIPQCPCRRRNKKNNHHFKALILWIYFSKRIKTREFVNIQTMPKYIWKKAIPIFFRWRYSLWILLDDGNSPYWLGTRILAIILYPALPKGLRQYTAMTN